MQSKNRKYDRHGTSNGFLIKGQAFDRRRVVELTEIIGTISPYGVLNTSTDTMQPSSIRDQVNIHAQFILMFFSLF